MFLHRAILMLRDPVLPTISSCTYLTILASLASQVYLTIKSYSTIASISKMTALQHLHLVVYQSKLLLYIVSAVDPQLLLYVHFLFVICDLRDYILAKIYYTFYKISLKLALVYCLSLLCHLLATVRPTIFLTTVLAIIDHPSGDRHTLFR